MSHASQAAVAPYNLRGLTIILLIHNRHDHLPRLFEYLREFEFQIIVADSSTIPAPVNARYARHFRVPHLNGFEKLAFVSAHISTEFAVLWADDDFVSLSGLDRALRIMREEPQAVCVAGAISKFSYSPWRGVCCWLDHTSRYYADLLAEPVDTETPSERLRRLAGRMQIHYAPMRSEAMTWAHRWMGDHPEFHHSRLWEKALPLLFAMKGRIRFVDCLMNLRSVDDRMTRDPKFAAEIRLATPLEALLDDGRPSALRGALQEATGLDDPDTIDAALQQIIASMKGHTVATDTKAIERAMAVVPGFVAEQKDDIDRLRRLIASPAPSIKHSIAHIAAIGSAFARPTPYQVAGGWSVA